MPVKNQVVRSTPSLSPSAPKAPPKHVRRRKHRPPATVVVPGPEPTNTGPKQTGPLTVDVIEAKPRRKAKAKAKTKRGHARGTHTPARKTR